MSDATNRSKSGALRGPNGHFLKGTAAGPGRPSLPDWFKARGPEALQVLVDVMTGEREDMRVSPAQAAQIVVERVYGKSPQSVDLTAPEISPAALAMLELLKSRAQ
jgi:hypothetical protein